MVNNIIQLMTPATGSRIIFGVLLVLAISTFAGSVDGSEKNHQPLKVVTLPFSLLSGVSDDELKSFSDHATDTVKSTVNSMGNTVIVIP
ncbi:MAG: hypothetical protein WB554_17140, partial [Desulfomonilaceae bacterium]